MMNNDQRTTVALQNLKSSKTHGQISQILWNAERSQQKVTKARSPISTKHTPVTTRNFHQAGVVESSKKRA